MKKTMTTISICLLMPTIALSMNKRTGAPRKGIRQISPLPFKPAGTTAAGDEKQSENERNKEVISVPLSLASSFLDAQQKERTRSEHLSKSTSSENDFSGNAEQPSEHAEIDGQNDQLTFLRNQRKIDRLTIAGLKRTVEELQCAVEELKHDRTMLQHGLTAFMYKTKIRECELALRMSDLHAAIAQIQQQQRSMAGVPMPNYYAQLQSRPHGSPYGPHHQ